MGIPDVRSEQPYAAVDTSIVRVSVVITDITDYISLIHMLHTLVTVFK